MKKYAIICVVSACLAAVLALGGVLVGTWISGERSAADPGAASSAADPTAGGAEIEDVVGSSGKIKIPGFEAMTFKAGQQEQAVLLTNPEANECYMILTILLPDGTEIYKSGMIAPGKSIGTIWLDQIPAVGIYPDAVLRYDCVAMDGITPLNGAQLKFRLEVSP